MNIDELYSKWEAVYDRFVSETDEDGHPLDDIDNMDFGNFAVGFFMGQGLSYDESLAFYHNVCVNRGKF